MDKLPSWHRSQPSWPTVQTPRSAPTSNWWLRLTSWEDPQEGLVFQDREKTRRSQLTAWMILGVAIVIVILLPVGLDDTGILVSLLLAGAGLALAGALNHHGSVTAAGILLVVLISGAVFGAVLSLPYGLSTDTLPAFALLSIAVVVASSVIWRSAGFIVAGINGVLICLVFFLQPRDTDLAADIAGYDNDIIAALTLLLMPIALMVILALVSFLWVRSMEQAMQRADRAEDLVALQHTIADQKHELDIGIQEILATHIRAANGDFTARAPLNQENVLWQIAASLNNLLGRLQRAGQAEARLARTEEELHRLEIAFSEARAGRTPHWPGPSGTAVDTVVQMILSSPGRTTAPPPPASGGTSGPSGPSNWPRPNSAPQQPTPPPQSNPIPQQPATPWTQTGFGPNDPTSGGGSSRGGVRLVPNEDEPGWQ